MTTGLFVYGSLQPGQENAFRLERIGGQWLEGSVRGTLLDRGWGAGIGFPALIPDDSGEEITGYLFRSPQLDSAWPELDAFEGSDYERLAVSVSLAAGQTVEAYVYALRQGSRELSITSSDRSHGATTVMRSLQAQPNAGSHHKT